MFPLRTPAKHEDGAGVPASARGASSSSVPPPPLPPPPAPPASDAAAAAGAAGAEVPPLLPELSEARAAALLRGEIPVFEVALAEAYGAGVRALSRSGGGSGAAHEELRPAELVAILATPAGPLRLLATHMLASLARSVTALGSGPSDERAARGVLYAALDAGALPVLFVAAAEAAAAIEKDSAAAWGSRVGALHALSVTSEFLSMLCSAAVLPPERACGVQTDAQLRTLAQACTASLRAAVALYQRKAPSEAEFAAAINLLSSFTFLELHDTMNVDLPDEAYRRDFSEGRFLYAGLCVLSAFPRTARAAAIGRVLHYGTNYELFCEALASGMGQTPPVDSFRIMLDAISSTSHDAATMKELLSAIGNITFSSGASEGLSAQLLQKGALNDLQPAILSSDAAVCLDAAYTIATLAMSKGAAEEVQKSGALTVVMDVLRLVAPGSVALDHAQFGSNDIPGILVLLSPDAPPAVQMAALSSLAASIHRPRNKELVGRFLSHAIRVCASTDDAFVFSASIFLLRSLGLALPRFRQVRAGGASDELDRTPLLEWSIEQVCQWVGKQPFSSYRSKFRDGMVSGAVLLSLTDKDLEGAGIEHPLHRRSILFAVEALAIAKGARGGGGGNGGGSDEAGAGGAAATGQGPSSPPPAAAALSRLASGSHEPAYDVFISYRRQGGADFAHLLKMTLASKGLEVFLDIENLGTGNFADHLDLSMRRAKNVVLVWTKGCMDRFLHDADAGQSDFVRREYALAMRLQKPIIPVIKDDFVIPAERDLPVDMRPILNYNGVKWSAEYREASAAKLRAALVL